MNDITRWESSQEMVNLFNDLKMNPEYLFSHEIENLEDVSNYLILEAFDTNEGYLVLDEQQDSKDNFLEIFGGGTGFSNVVGAKPWKFYTPTDSPPNVAADFYADLGRGRNNRIYFDKGWMAWFPEGYSTMTLVEFYDEPKTHKYDIFDINGKIYHGEKAFARLKVLEVDSLVYGKDWSWSPDSINRWVI